MKQVFTFGFGHLDGTGGRRYAVVYGNDRNHCRDRMYQQFGQKWAFQYDSEEAAGVQEFGLELYATIDDAGMTHPTEVM